MPVTTIKQVIWIISSGEITEMESFCVKLQSVFRKPLVLEKYFKQGCHI